MVCSSPLMCYTPFGVLVYRILKTEIKSDYFFFPIAGFFFFFFGVGWGRGGRMVGLHSTDYFRLKTQVKLSYYGRAGTLYCFNANNAPGTSIQLLQINVKRLNNKYYNEPLSLCTRFQT